MEGLLPRATTQAVTLGPSHTDKQGLQVTRVHGEHQPWQKGVLGLWDQARPRLTGWAHIQHAFLCYEAGGKPSGAHGQGSRVSRDVVMISWLKEERCSQQGEPRWKGSRWQPETFLQGLLDKKHKYIKSIVCLSRTLLNIPWWIEWEGNPKREGIYV